MYMQWRSLCNTCFQITKFNLELKITRAFDWFLSILFDSWSQNALSSEVRFTKQGRKWLKPNFKIKFENSDFFVTTGRYGRTKNIWLICRPGLSKSPISRQPDRALFLPSNVYAYMFRKPSHILGNFPASFHFSSAPPTGSPESQQHTGSQIIRICMGLYLKINKMVTARPGKVKIPLGGIDGENQLIQNQIRRVA